MPASLSAAPTRSQAISSSDLLLTRRRLQRLPSRTRERPHHAHAPAAATAEFVGHGGDALVLAPPHVHVAGDQARLRHVVVILDIHHHLFARPEQQQGLVRPRPSGHPPGGVPDVQRADDQEMVDAGSLHHSRQQVTPTRVFRIGKTRIVLLENRPQLRRQLDRVGR
jgi:hypothetical protein